MGKGRLAALCATLACGAGLTGFAAASFGDDEMSYATVAPAMEAAGGAGQAKLQARKAKKPKVTHLITRDLITVEANQEIVARLQCARRDGIALDGGALSPPAPDEVAVSILSRFDPNQGNTPARSYFVGVRNFGDADAQFRATLVCAKGIKEA